MAFIGNSGTSTDPEVTLTNTNTDANGAVLRFIKDAGQAGADNDISGVIEFYADDDNQDNILFAKIEGYVADASNGDECGGLKLYVAENDGNPTAGLSIIGSTTDGEVDVTIGAGAASLTTIAGDLDIPNGGFALGSDASGDMYYNNSSGVLTRIAVGSDNHVLTLNGAVPGWESASGGGDVSAGSTFTTAGVIMACDGSDKTIDEPGATLTTNGQGITVGGTLTTGVDDTGVDVRFYSATTNEGVLYDASEDELGLLLTTKLKFHDIGGGEEIFASANGHLEINSGTTLDITAPTVDINAATAVTIDGPAVTVASSAASSPILHITNTHAGATSGELRFNKDSASGADSDVMGLISFYGTDDSDNAHERLAYVDAIITDSAHGSEASSLRFYVAENDATLTQGLLIAGQADADGEVDVTIAAGAASTTTINGTLTVTGATTYTAAATFNGAVTLGDATGDDIVVTGYVASHIVPKTSDTYDLGTSSLMWRDIYTGDLHLSNKRGNWSVVEEEDMLTIRNNLTGKWYKMGMTEIDPTGRDEGMNKPPVPLP